MEDENRRSISHGFGLLYDPITPDEITLALQENRLLFFYLSRKLLGFIRLLHLAPGIWEVGSAVSSPTLRRQYTGFNLLFQTASLFHLESETGRNGPLQRVLIVTYHIEVARSIHRQIDQAYHSPISFQKALFDFTQIVELTLTRRDPLIDLLHLRERVKKKLPFFVFDIAPCIQMPEG